MKVEVEEVGATQLRLSVELPADRVAAEFDRVLQAVSRRANIKGFRPGRTPRALLQRYYGEEVHSQVAEALVREAFVAAVQEAKRDVVSDPREFELGSLAEREVFCFRADVEVRPRIETIDVAGLGAERPVETVGDPDVDEVLTRLRERYAELTPITDRSELSRGDFATVDIEVASEGTVRPDLGVEGGAVEVAGGQLPSPVDERLAIARVGETFSVALPAPDSAPPELVGQTLDYRVIVKAISQKNLPALDDEFAKDHGDCETLQQLRGKIGEQLRADAARRGEQAVRESVLDQVLAKNPVELPKSLVARRVEEILHDFKHDLGRRGMRFSSREHEEEARSKLRSRAERDVHAQLLLDALAQRDGISIEDQDVSEEIGRLAAQGVLRKEDLQDRERLIQVRGALTVQIRRARVLEGLLSSADVRDVAAARPEK